MKKFLFLLSAALIVFASCEKADDVTSDEMILKKKPANQQNGGNAYMIVAPGNEDPLYLAVGESVQLSVAPDPTLSTSWYIVQQSIAYVNWVGEITGVSPGVTVVYARHIREHGNPYQDNMIVYVGNY